MLLRVLALLVAFTLAVGGGRWERPPVQAGGTSALAAAAPEQRDEVARHRPQVDGARLVVSTPNGPPAKPQPASLDGTSRHPRRRGRARQAAAARRRSRAGHIADGAPRSRDQRSGIRRARSSAHVPHLGEGDAPGAV